MHLKEGHIYTLTLIRGKNKSKGILLLCTKCWRRSLSCMVTVTAMIIITIIMLLTMALVIRNNNPWQLINTYIYIYIFIYLYMCVCVFCTFLFKFTNYKHIYKQLMIICSMYINNHPHLR